MKSSSFWGILLLVSAIFGINITLLYYIRIITDILAVLPYVIVFALLIVIVVIASAILGQIPSIGQTDNTEANRISQCIRCYADSLMAGALLTLLAAFALLVIGNLTPTIPILIILFLAAAAFIFTILVLIIYINCLVAYSNGKRFKK